MRYLMCVIHETGVVYDYTEVTQDEETKISQLYQSKKLPPTWSFKGKQIVTDTILGFTDKPLPYEKKQLEIKNFDELRSWVQQQKWYQRSQKPADVPQTNLTLTP